MAFVTISLIWASQLKPVRICWEGEHTQLIGKNHKAAVVLRYLLVVEPVSIWWLEVKWICPKRRFQRPVKISPLGTKPRKTWRHQIDGTNLFWAGYQQKFETCHSKSALAYWKLLISRPVLVQAFQHDTLLFSEAFNKIFHHQKLLSFTRFLGQKISSKLLFKIQKRSTKAQHSCRQQRW